MAKNNTIWGRLWESTEGDLVTIRLPRSLADELLSALSIGCDSGDGLDNDMDGDDDSDDDSLDLDMGDDDEGGDDGVDMLLVGDDDDEDDEDEKDEASTYSKSGGDPSGMRPKTALGESRTPFQRLRGRIKAQPKGKTRR